MTPTRKPDINDPVMVTITLPGWIPDEGIELLNEDADLEAERVGDSIIVTVEARGNCNALVNARMTLEAIDDVFRETGIDVMSFGLTAAAVIA